MRRFLPVLLAAAMACGGGSGTTTPPPPPPGPAPVATVSVTVNPASVAAGSGAQASATLRDAGGNTLTGRTINWSSGNPGVATVNGSGAIITVSPGTTLITAISEGQSGSAQLTVTPRPVAVVTVTLANPSIAQGATTTATAQTLDVNGTPLTGRTVSWSSSNPAVATVSGAGQVTAVTPGTTTINATSENVTGGAQLTVTPPPVATVQVFGISRVKVGDPYQYTVEARLADGTLVQRPVTWSIAEPGRATVNASGLVVPLVAGSITLQATVDGVTGGGTLTAYDWTPTTTSSGFGLVLEADLAVTNKFGTSAYPLLVIVCGNTGLFSVGIGLPNMVTANGGVAYAFDNGNIISDTWIEGSSFDLLIWPGFTNLSHKNFANLLALASRFSFGFNEFQGSSHATVFRTTGLAALLPPLLTGCPGNFLREDPSIRQAPEDVIRDFVGKRLSSPDRVLRKEAGASLVDRSREPLTRPSLSAVELLKP